MSEIKTNLESIKNSLIKGVSLLAVSKTKPCELITEAYEAGQVDFGENKVQDLLEKARELEKHSNIRWHFIGHLQTNKINNLLATPNLVSIHSIDSIKLLNKLLNKKIDKKILANKKIGLFIQVNTSGEEEKGGFTDLAHIREAVDSIKASESFYLQGLMTIGKIRTEDFEKDARSSFQQLKDLKLKLDEENSLNLELSMGMSQDYLIAQEYGANWVRVGSSIFGKRS